MYKWCKFVILWNVFLESISFMYFLHTTNLNNRIRLFLWYPQFIPLPYCCLKWLLLVRKPPGTDHLCLFVFFEKKNLSCPFSILLKCALFNVHLIMPNFCVYISRAFNFFSFQGQNATMCKNDNSITARFT